MLKIDRMADILKMLGNESRLTILALLRERELCVCELVEILEISQPAVSQHLRRLKSYELVKEDRRGQWVYYSLNVEDKPFVRDILEAVPCQRNQLENLDAVC